MLQQKKQNPPALGCIYVCLWYLYLYPSPAHTPQSKLFQAPWQHKFSLFHTIHKRICSDNHTTLCKLLKASRWLTLGIISTQETQVEFKLSHPSLSATTHSMANLYITQLPSLKQEGPHLQLSKSQSTSNSPQILVSPLLHSTFRVLQNLLRNLSGSICSNENVLSNFNLWSWAIEDLYNTT